MSNLLLNIILLIFILLFVTLGYRSYKLNDGLYIIIFAIGIITIISGHHHWLNDVFISVIIVVNGITHHLYEKNLNKKRMLF